MVMSYLNVFKEIIFTVPTVYCKTDFVQLEKQSKDGKPVIWHECISETSPKDMISTSHRGQTTAYVKNIDVLLLLNLFYNLQGYH